MRAGLRCWRRWRSGAAGRAPSGQRRGPSAGRRRAALPWS
nr:MAG TPA_asm: hypothetical protein [Bacteriophage sp.]